MMFSENREYTSFFNDVTRFIELNTFLSVYKFVIRHKVLDNIGSKKLLEVLSYMHVKEWIYCAYEKGKIAAVAGAYRISEFKEDGIEQLPVDDGGDILYVPFAASSSSDKTILKKLLDKAVQRHGNIKEIIFYEGDSKTPKRYKLHTSEKGEENGKKQES